MSASQEQADLVEALEIMFWLIDERWLVRNLQGDDDPMWALTTLGYVRKLAKAKAVLDAAQAVPRETGESSR